MPSPESLAAQLARCVELFRDAGAKEAQKLEISAFIEIRPTPARDAVRLARTGHIKDSFSALSILMCEDLLREYGYI